jgi:hypothetical protein
MNIGSPMSRVTSLLWNNKQSSSKKMDTFGSFGIAMLNQEDDLPLTSGECTPRKLKKA